MNCCEDMDFKRDGDITFTLEPQYLNATEKGWCQSCGAHVERLAQIDLATIQIDKDDWEVNDVEEAACPVCGGAGRCHMCGGG